MKKLIFILGICLILFAILAAGCLGENDPADHSSDNSSNNTLPNSSANSSNNAPPIAPPVASPKDTVMFSGWIEKIKTVNNTTEIVVKNANSQMRFVFSDRSRMNFNLSDLKVDQYLKVYFDTPVIVTDQKPVPVVVANFFEFINYEGEIINVTPSSPKSFSDIQSIEVESWYGSVISPMVFHCNETQFFMDLQDIKVGTAVSIRGVNIVLENTPPQAEAYEVFLSSIISSVIVCYSLSNNF